MSFTYTVGEGFKKSAADSGKPIYRFSIDGVVELPNLTVIGSPRYNEEAYSIETANVVCLESGSADYKFVVKSYDSTGGDEVTHIDSTISLSSKSVTALTISTASVGANRSLQLEVQSLSGTSSKDITITLL